jgi:hypothetical protein
MSSSSSPSSSLPFASSDDAGLNAPFYRFIYYVSSVMLFIWLSRLIFRVKHLLSLYSSYQTRRLLRFDSARGFNPLQLTRDYLESLLQSKVAYQKYPMQSVRTPIHIIMDEIKFSYSQSKPSELTLHIPYNSAIGHSIELFVLIGVHQNTVKQLFQQFSQYLARQKALYQLITKEGNEDEDKPTRGNSLSSIARALLPECVSSHSIPAFSHEFIASHVLLKHFSPNILNTVTVNLPCDKLEAAVNNENLHGLVIIALGIQEENLIQTNSDRINQQISVNQSPSIMRPSQIQLSSFNEALEMTQINKEKQSSEPAALSSFTPNLLQLTVLNLHSNQNSSAVVIPIDSSSPSRTSSASLPFSLKPFAQYFLAPFALRCVENHELYGLPNPYSSELINKETKAQQEAKSQGNQIPSRDLPSSSSKSELFPSDQYDCIVCLSAPKDLILLPCRHLCICSVCFKNVEKCPLCREKIQDYLKFRVPREKERKKENHTEKEKDKGKKKRKKKKGQ